MLGCFSFLLGDNLQTAITVARNSGMVSEGQKVILIEASESTGSSSASISWKLVEEKKPIAYGNQVYLKTDFPPYYPTCFTVWATSNFDLQWYTGDLGSTYFSKCLTQAV